MRTVTITLRSLLLLFFAALPALANADTLDAPLLNIQHQWAHITYQLPKAKQESAFVQLAANAAALVRQYPNRAEPKLWQAIVLSSEAGVRGGFGALSLVDRARDLLLAAEKIDPTAMNGSIYTTLGSLYYQVPGWPLSFGSDAKAKTLLLKALQFNPNGIDPNYFYGDYLFRNGRKPEALAALDKALQAPPRPGRALADQGRRKQIRTLIAKIKNEG